MSSNVQHIQYKLCNASEMSNDSMKEFTISLPELAEKSTTPVKVLLVKQNNQFYCIAPKCSHYGVPLVNGVVYKNRVRCFAHGACFNIKTGDIEDYPGVDCIPKHDVFIDNLSDVYVRTTIDKLLNTKRIRTDESQQVQEESHRPCSANVRVYSRHSSAVKSLKSKCLIIGSGAAGLLCADTLREHGYGSNITVITKESCLPYDRPKLSKALDAQIDAIKLRDESFFATHQINYMVNQQVDTVDFEKRQVHCKSGRVFDYDKLVIATGLNSAKSRAKNAQLTGVFTLRSYADLTAMKVHFDRISAGKKPNLILVGGSFISMEAASFFADKAQVTVMSRRKPFEAALGTQASLKIQKLHESKGVKFFTDPKFDIVEFKESKSNPGTLESVKLNDGSVWPVDLCLLAIGSKTEADFLRNTNLKLNVDNYIYVDKHMKTNVDNVYAAGDVTFFPRSCLAGLDFTSNKTNKSLDYVNIGHWGVASLQGRIAALSIVDSDQKNTTKVADEHAFRVVPFFWSTQCGKAIRFAGFNDHYDQVVFHEDKTKTNEYKFAAFYLTAKKVVAACTLDYDPVCAVLAEAMHNNIEVLLEHIENDPLDIKKLLK